MMSWLSWFLLTAQAGTVLPAPQKPYFPTAFAEQSVTCDFGGGPRRVAIMDAFKNEWYSGHLRAADEPSLYLAALPRPNRAILRFTWLRSFHAPVMVRIEGNDGADRLTATQLSGAGGYAPGTVARQVRKSLSSAQGERLRALLADTRVFDLPPIDCSLGLDGAQWILEQVGPSGYQFVDRWGPDDAGVRRVGEFMLELTGWHFEEVY